MTTFELAAGDFFFGPPPEAAAGRDKSKLKLKLYPLTVSALHNWETRHLFLTTDAEAGRGKRMRIGSLPGDGPQLLCRLWLLMQHHSLPSAANGTYAVQADWDEVLLRPWGRGATAMTLVAAGAAQGCLAFEMHSPSGRRLTAQLCGEAVITGLRPHADLAGYGGLHSVALLSPDAPLQSGWPVCLYIARGAATRLINSSSLNSVSQPPEARHKPPAAIPGGVAALAVLILMCNVAALSFVVWSMTRRRR